MTKKHWQKLYLQRIEKSQGPLGGDRGPEGMVRFHPSKKGCDTLGHRGQGRGEKVKSHLRNYLEVHSSEA